jgi:hypothetical protein
MSKKNEPIQDVEPKIELSLLLGYKQFLESSIQRVEYGLAFDQWLRSELIVKQKETLLHEMNEDVKNAYLKWLKQEIDTTDARIKELARA